MICDEPSKRLGRQEWDVAVDNENIALKSVKLCLSSANSVSRAALLLLESKKNIGSPTDLLNGIGLMTDHHNKTARVKTLAGLNDMPEEWFSGQVMQDLDLG